MLLARLLPVAALATLACITNADILRLDPMPRPPTHPDSVQLIGQEPNRPYAVIAIVSTQSGFGSDLIRARLIKEAARLGGHAVLFDISSLTRVGGDDGERQQLTGKVIVFTDSTRYH